MATTNITNDMQAKAAILPEGKARAKRTVGDGLYLLINKSGKYWKYAYKYDGKRKEASLGVYSPGSDKHVSLKEAKAKVQDVKRLLADGIDPNHYKREKRQANIAATQQQKVETIADANTFEVVARLWHGTHKDGWADKHANTILRRFELHVFPFIGSVPVLRPALFASYRIGLFQVKQIQLSHTEAGFSFSWLSVGYSDYCKLI